MTEHPEISHLDRDQRIRNIAYTIWEEEGRPDGRAEIHWLRACELVDAEAAEPADGASAADMPAGDPPGWLKRSETPPAALAEPPRTIADVARKVAGRAA